MPNGVTYAGQPAVLDYNQTIARFVAQRWPASRWPFAHGRNSLPLAANPFGQHEIKHRFALPYPDVPAPRINEVIIPTGASRYGRGLFLFGRQEMAYIASNVWGFSGDLATIPESWGASNQSAELRIEYGEIATFQMRALPPVLIDGSGKNELWLLPLVDKRYQWQQSPANAILSQGATWASLLTKLGQAIGESISHSVSSVHGWPDRESFDDPGVSATVAIDSVSLSTGVRVVPSATGSPVLSTPATSSQKLAYNVMTLQPWLGGRVPRRSLPGKVALVGRKAVDHFGQCGDSYAVETNVGGGSLNDAKITVHSPWWVEHFRESLSAGAVDIAPNAASVALFGAVAASIAADIAAWGAVQYSYSVPGVRNWELTGYDDYLAIRVGGVDQLDSVSTHIQSLPPDFAPLVHLGQRANVYIHPNDSAVFTPLAEQTGPWRFSNIWTVDGPYAGTDVRPVAVRMLTATSNQCDGTCEVTFVSDGSISGTWEVSRPCSNEGCACPPLPTDVPDDPARFVRELPCINECAPPMMPGTQSFAHYQCERGWTADSASSMQMPKLPAWEIEGKLESSLHALDETGVAKFRSIRSNFPYIGHPPGVNENCEVEFENKWRLDATCDSKVILQRIAECPGSPACSECDGYCEVTYHTGDPGYWTYSGDPCPEGCDCPPLPTDHPGGPTTRRLYCVTKPNPPRWELRQVEKFKARYIKFRFETGGGGDYDIIQWWEGENPKSCDPYVNIQFPLGQPCNDCDMIAFYDPMTDSYQANTSPSAVVGEPETVNIVNALAFEGCSINYIKQTIKAFCAGDPSLINTEPDLEPASVVTGAGLVQTTEPCGSFCRYDWNGEEEKWELSEGCYVGGGADPDPNCQCGPPPTQPPGLWNDYQLWHDVECTKTRITGLQFETGVVYVCASESRSPIIIPINDECPDEEGPGY